MKDATKYQTKMKTLLTGLKRVRVPADSGDPIRLLVESVMEANAGGKDVDKAMATFEKEFVDLNELRVAQPREIVEMLSKSFPHVRAKAVEVTDALNRIFNRANDLSMAYMEGMAKRDLRRHLTRIGLSPYATARIVSVGFEGHAVPVDEDLAETLLMDGYVPESATLEEIEGFLERVVSLFREAFDGFDFFVTNSRYRNGARTHRNVIEVNGAGATLGDAATKLGAYQI